MVEAISNKHLLKEGGEEDHKVTDKHREFRAAKQSSTGPIKDLKPAAVKHGTKP